MKKKIKYELRFIVIFCFLSYWIFYFVNLTINNDVLAFSFWIFSMIVFSTCILFPYVIEWINKEWEKMKDKWYDIGKERYLENN